MFELLLLAVSGQVQTVRLPPAAPPQEVATVRLLPDLIVKEIRIQDDRRMHVLVANVGTGAVGDYFPVRASVEIAGESRELRPTYSKPLAAGEEAWVELAGEWTVSLTKAASATAIADQYPEPKPRTSMWNLGPSMPSFDSWLASTFPEMKKPCKEIKGCVTEINEDNNAYAVAGVPRGTPERLNAPGPAPESIPERGR